MTECIFCKIIEGTIPSAKVYEDEHVLAFMDIVPVTKGHVLLIPKTHRENIYDLTAEEAAQLFSVVPKIANAIKDEFKPAGMNLLQNNGAYAGQAVFHSTYTSSLAMMKLTASNLRLKRRNLKQVWNEFRKLQLEFE